jgi:hypothetical protein
MLDILIELKKNWWVEISAYYTRQDQFEIFNSKYKRTEKYLEKKLELIHKEIPFLKKYWYGKNCPWQWEAGYYSHIKKIYREYTKLPNRNKNSLLKNSSEQKAFINKCMYPKSLWWI